MYHKHDYSILYALLATVALVVVIALFGAPMMAWALRFNAQLELGLKWLFSTVVVTKAAWGGLAWTQEEAEQWLRKEQMRRFVEAEKAKAEAARREAEQYKPLRIKGM